MIYILLYSAFLVFIRQILDLILPDPKRYIEKRKKIESQPIMNEEHQHETNKKRLILNLKALIKPAIQIPIFIFFARLFRNFHSHANLFGYEIYYLWLLLPTLIILNYIYSKIKDYLKNKLLIYVIDKLFNGD